MIVGAGAAFSCSPCCFPLDACDAQSLLSSAGWMSAGRCSSSLLVLTGVCQRILGRPLRRFAVSLLAIFGVALLSQAVASIPQLNDWASRGGFFSVIFGLVISNFSGCPSGLKPAIQSEFYQDRYRLPGCDDPSSAKMLNQGVYALDPRLSSSSLRCGTSPSWLARRIACGRETSYAAQLGRRHLRAFRPPSPPASVIRGDNKKLSYIISLVLECAVPMISVIALAGRCCCRCSGEPRNRYEKSQAPGWAERSIRRVRS